MKKALEAAYRVLEEAGKPLHYKEIARLALSGGHWQTAGQTPEATINAQIASDIKKLGTRSRFRRHQRGVFASSASPQPAADSTANQRGRQPSGAMSFTDAAEKILERSPDRKPLTAKEITNRAIKQRLISTQGRTPDATMYAAIYQECQRRGRRGEPLRFERLPKSRVGLRKWQPAGIARQIDQHNRDIRKKLLAGLKGLKPKEFETLIGKLLTALGFESVEVTRLHKDGGIDARGTLVVGDSIRIKMAVQAKKWKHNVQSQQVQQVRGSFGVHDQGLIVTTSDYSPAARKEAEEPDRAPVGLMNGEQLVGLLVEHEIGAKRTSHDMFELDLEGLSDTSKDDRK